MLTHTEFVQYQQDYRAGKRRWTEKSINWSFLRNLRAKVGRDDFSLIAAYGVYRDHHWRSWMYKSNKDVPPNAVMDNWGEMTVRNIISAAIYLGYLTHVDRGIYCFTKPPSRKERT